MSQEYKKPQAPKEIDIFNRHSRYNKFKVLIIAISIAVVAMTSLYFFTKSLLTYTVTYYTDGGTVYGEELKSDDYKFLQKTKEPKNLKKEGYYIEGYYTDKNFKHEYKFGTSIWRSKKLYVKWAEGYAVQLFFIEGEDDDDRIIQEKTGINHDYLKLYYEQYVKPGSEYQLPLVFNDKGGYLNRHLDEQLLWYMDENASGEPFDTKQFVVDKNIKIYGRWFDTKSEKYEVSDDGTLIRYLGYCNYLKFPNTIRKIKDIEPVSNFVDGLWDETRVADGTYYSAFDRVIRDLKQVYLNNNLSELGSCSFYRCNSLELVKFTGNNLTTIGKRALAACSALADVKLPTSVTTIDDEAFSNTWLKTISGLDNVTRIGDGAFQGTSLRTITLPSLEFAGRRALYSCYSLETVILGSNKVVETNVDTISGDNNNNVLYLSSKAKIYVNDNLVDSYKTTYPWDYYNTNGSRIYSINSLAQ